MFLGEQKGDFGEVVFATIAEEDFRGWIQLLCGWVQVQANCWLEPSRARCASAYESVQLH